MIAGGRYFGMSFIASAARVKQLAHKLQFTSYLDNYPDTLSGGYKQRVLIARSLMHSPQLIILDEPTAGLDPQVRRELWALIKELRDEGITILLTTHYIEEAEQLSDYVCVLDKGSVRLIDTPENLIKTFKKKNLEDVFIQLVDEKKE